MPRLSIPAYRTFPLEPVSPCRLTSIGDSQNDVKFKNLRFFAGPYQGGTVDFAPGKFVGFTSGNAYVSALNSGAPINSGTLGTSFFGSDGLWCFQPYYAQFNNVTDKYVGLSFSCWAACIRIMAGCGSMSRTRRTISSLRIGHTRMLPVPESWPEQCPSPVRLACSPLGALGVAALRRKRRTAETSVVTLPHSTGIDQISRRRDFKLAPVCSAFKQSERNEIRWKFDAPCAARQNSLSKPPARVHTGCRAQRRLESTWIHRRRPRSLIPGSRKFPIGRGFYRDINLDGDRNNLDIRLKNYGYSNGNNYQGASPRSVLLPVKLSVFT